MSDDQMAPFPLLHQLLIFPAKHGAVTGDLPFRDGKKNVRNAARVINLLCTSGNDISGMAILPDCPPADTVMKGAPPHRQSRCRRKAEPITLAPGTSDCAENEGNVHSEN